MKAPFRLLEDQPAEDVVAHFRKMLAKAERGEVLGEASVYMLKSRQFVMQTTGEASRSPVYVIGMLVVLILKLARVVLK